jgi:hypothetical protein
MYSRGMQMYGNAAANQALYEGSGGVVSQGAGSIYGWPKKY